MTMIKVGDKIFGKAMFVDEPQFYTIESLDAKISRDAIVVRSEDRLLRTMLIDSIIKDDWRSREIY